MMLSMTGFGKTNCTYNNKKISIEIKTLNSKQADIITKIPGIFKEVELELRNELINKLERGKIECGIWIDNHNSDRHTVINETVVIDYHNQLSTITKKLGISQDLLLQTAMRLPDVLKIERPEFNKEEWKLIFSSVRDTINLVIEYRRKEGKTLEKDILQRINNINLLLDKVSKYESGRITDIKERIISNHTDLFKNISHDKNRFEQEMIYYLEKIDITEEKVRLKYHCDFFIESSKESISNGKKLSFITQEIGREINTIGSKANNINIQKIVVEMKDELEKIKEQVLNIL